MQQLSTSAWSILNTFDRIADRLSAGAGERLAKAEAKAAIEAARQAGAETDAVALAAVDTWLRSREAAGGQVSVATDIPAARAALQLALAATPEVELAAVGQLPEGISGLVEALVAADAKAARTNRIVFWVNGARHVVHDPDPRTLLLDYLRSAEVGLTGTKKVCAQGGCGACTVTLSQWNAGRERVEHSAINSCLRPLCAVDGMAITTIEGIGSTAPGEQMSPVQYQVAVDNGSQCGYCTPGWVMSMYSYLVGNPDAKLSQIQIEELFDGNLCRCTGFRPILYAMKHFAKGWSPADEAGSMKCDPWPSYDAKTGGGLIPIPLKREPQPKTGGIRHAPAPVRIKRGDYEWIRVLSLASLERLITNHAGADPLRFVVGNTSIGIYGEPAQDVSYGPPYLRVDIASIPDLHGLAATPDGLVVGAATTYTEFLAFLDQTLADAEPAWRSGLEAVHYMAHRTAGRIVRDAASLGGNTMIVVQHVSGPPTVAPFPSDMFTTLSMMDAQVDVTCPAWGEVRTLPILAFTDAWQQDAGLQAGAILLRYRIPHTQAGELARTFKVALREVNAHSIVNAGMRVRLSPSHTVEAASIVYAGTGPVAYHLRELEAWMVGKTWDAELLRGGLERVTAGVSAEIEASRERMAQVPDEGFTHAYQIHLAESFFYQFHVWVAEQRGLEVPAPLRSAGERPPRPVSRGTQDYEPYPSEYPVNKAFIKAEAFMQATGEAVYTHDAPVPGGGVEGAPVLSIQPLANFGFATPDGRALDAAELAAKLRDRYPSFVDLVTAADIPGKNSQGWAGPPDPLICEGYTTACGQVLAIVLAKTAQAAINIAYEVQQRWVAYATTPVVVDGATQELVLTLDEAIAANTVLNTAEIWGIERSGTSLDWAAPGTSRATLSGPNGPVECAVVHGRQMSTCPQMHFYLETQSALVTPGDNGDFTVLCSTQNPSTILGAVSGALGVGSNKVDVQIRRVGGGYGGKGPRSPWAAANAAVSAAKIGRPVKIAMTRETDSALFGHENPLRGTYHAAIGTGADDPDNAGLLVGLDIDYAMDAGNTADCSSVVMDCVLLRADNGYFVSNYRTMGNVFLTNVISNTSFRSLDAISGIIILEDALERAAHSIGMVPEAVREKNLYRLGDATPYGQVLEYCYLGDVWRYTKDRVKFDERLAAVREFNASNRWTKRGISMIPVKYGMGFNTASMERGDALIDIYSGDGTVIVRHGACEIGQGVNTQVIQLVAEALNIPVYLIECGTTSTAVIPNPESTGASTGTAFNGGAAQKGAERLRKRLEAYCLDMLNSKGRAYCIAQNLNFWDYDTGWNTWIEAGDDKFLLWTKIVSAANGARVNMSTQAQHNETGGTRSDNYDELLFRDGQVEKNIDNFVGFTYSAACTEVEVNILTGETTILRTDLVYDMGKSINPATDVGQVEGAFVQGIGRVLLENVVWQPDGPRKGMNNTPNTWGYKIPATTSIPLEFNVDLYPREASSEVPDNPNLLMSAKEVGEPPLCLAATVYFAVKHAILASREERDIEGWFDLDMPCTVQRVREACEVEREHLVFDA